MHSSDNEAFFIYKNDVKKKQIKKKKIQMNLLFN